MTAQTGIKQQQLDAALEAVRRLRAEGARVHCLTNTVAQNLTANVLLACGATPSMTVAPDEVVHFTNRADAVLINLGTLDSERIAAIRTTANTCSETAKPFVLDPVMCHVSPPRLALAREIMGCCPTVVRLNRDEAGALETDGEARGGVTVVTGEQDQVHFADHCMIVANGHPFLSRVTAIGCAQGALMAALLTKTEAATAALAALVWFGVAGEIAAQKSSGPGSFQVRFTDELHSVSIPDLRKRARLT